MVAVLAAGAVVWVVQGTFGSGPKTFTTQCSGASITGTIWMDRSAVVAQVSVLDDREREWQVNWKTGFGFELLPTSPEGSMPAGAQTISDTDNGTQRSIFLRPEGETESCELQMGVQWLHY